MPCLLDRVRIAAAALALLAALGAGAQEGKKPLALEIGVEGRAGNIHFPWASLSPTPGAGAYPSDNYFWGGAAWVSAPIGSEASLRFGYETDPVLRNLLTGSIEFERGAARIAVGPFLGFLNSDSTPFSSGLSTTIALQWPGIAYASLTSAGGLALGLVTDVAGIEPQALAELKAGFYARNAIVSGSFTAKRFCDADPSGALVIDYLSSYYLTIEAFKKNVPYTILAKAGYELRSKYYEASDAADSLGSVILGLDLGFEVAPGVEIRGGLSSGIFVFGLDSLAGRSPDADTFLFSASFGCVVRTERLRAAPKRQSQAQAAPVAQAAQTDSSAAPVGKSGSDK